MLMLCSVDISGRSGQVLKSICGDAVAVFVNQDCDELYAQG